MGIEARAGRESRHDLQFSLTNMGMEICCMHASITSRVIYLDTMYLHVNDLHSWLSLCRLSHVGMKASQHDKAWFRQTVRLGLGWRGLTDTAFCIDGASSCSA